MEFNLWPTQRADQSSLENENTLATLDPQNPCGPVAVRVISQCLGVSTSLSKCGEIVPCDSLGRSTMAELQKGLETLGILSVGITVHQESISEIKLPMIMHVNNNHFVVSLPNDHGVTVIIDPPKAPVPADTLPFKWDGHALLCSNSKAALNAELDRLGVELP
ncbi:cysteine peptidase family C39 domain-containing protein [Gimesia fumaroli]|nr:cysteine peptidase family C39 domain-containing protein [Gimesia fumaroli]